MLKADLKVNNIGKPDLMSLPEAEKCIFFETLLENSELGKFIEQQKNKPEQGCSDLLADGELAPKKV